MGWKWKSSRKAGVVRVNLSSSGVGYSIGVTGFRVGIDAKGRNYTHASIAGTGLYNRTYHNKKKNSLSTLPGDDHSDNFSTSYIIRNTEKSESEDTLYFIGAFSAVAAFVCMLGGFLPAMLILILISFSFFKMGAPSYPLLEKTGLQFDSNILIMSNNKLIENFDQLYEKLMLNELENLIDHLRDEEVLALIIHRMDSLGSLALKSPLIKNKIKDPLDNVAGVLYLDEVPERFNYICWRAVIASQSHFFYYAQNLFLYYLKTAEDKNIRLSMAYYMGLSYFQGKEFEKAEDYLSIVNDEPGNFQEDSAAILRFIDGATEDSLGRSELVDYFNLGHDEYLKKARASKMIFYKTLENKLDAENLRKLEKIKNSIDEDTTKELEKYLGKKLAG